MNKKGTLTDLIVFVVLSIVVVMFLALLVYGIGTLTTQLLSVQGTVGNGTTISSVASDTFGELNEAVGRLRLISFSIIFGMILSIFISSYLVRVHPLFFFVYLAVIILGVIISVPISNTWEGLLTNDAFGSTLQSFTASNFIILNLPVITTVVGFIGLILLLGGMNRDEGLGGPI